MALATTVTDDTRVDGGRMKLAASMLALCACGDGIAAPDASSPGADDDRGVVEVHVTAVDIFRPTSVYFQERDSTLAVATRLDQNGRARGYLRPGGFVTVVPSIVGGVTPLYTYANVSPGDVLEIDPGQALKGGAQARIRLPSLIGTQTFVLETPCGTTDISAATAMQVQVDLTGCGDKTDLLVIAYAPAGEVYFYENDVPLSESIPVNLDYRDRTYRAFEDTTAAITGLPDVDRWFVQKGVALGTNYVAFTGSSRAVENGSVAFTAPTPMGPGITAVTTSFSDAVVDVNGPEVVIDWQPSASVTTLDHREHQLRAQTAPATYVPLASSIQWGEDSVGLAPQITLARMQWATPETLYQWTVLGKRRDEPRLELPVLPRPELTPDPNSPPYDLYRLAVSGGAATVTDRLLGWTPTAARWPVEGDTGTVVYQRLSQQ